VTQFLCAYIVSPYGCHILVLLVYLSLTLYLGLLYCMRNIYRRFSAYEFSLVNYVTPKKLYMVTLLVTYNIGLYVFTIWDTILMVELV